MADIAKFNKMFEVCSISIPFRTEWNNGTGYYKLGELPQLGAGDCVKSVNSDGRKLILFGVSHGTAVVFQRDPDPADSRVCYNMPSEDADKFDISWTGSISDTELGRLAEYLALN